MQALSASRTGSDVVIVSKAMVIIEWLVLIAMACAPSVSFVSRSSGSTPASASGTSDDFNLPLRTNAQGVYDDREFCIDELESALRGICGADSPNAGPKICGTCSLWKKWQTWGGLSHDQSNRRHTWSLFPSFVRQISHFIIRQPNYATQHLYALAVGLPAHTVQHRLGGHRKGKMSCLVSRMPNIAVTALEDPVRHEPSKILSGYLTVLENLCKMVSQ
ncbi:hypothetical protein EDD15DRAFT_2205047 [Pisolithus albus]|nr:hypothetical protein EDD15DRAFT_2205047 [Pisolithus albus]